VEDGGGKRVLEVLLDQVLEFRLFDLVKFSISEDVSEEVF